MNSNIFQRLSLKKRVTFFVLVIFLAGIWSLSLYASRMLRADMQRLAGDQQFSTVSVIAAHIDDEFNDRLRALETVAASVTPALLGKPVALQALLEKHTILQRLFFSSGIIALRAEGTAIAEIPPSAGRIGVNYMDRDHVAAAIKEGKATIGRPVVGRKPQAPIISMTVPIRDAQGKVIGALTGAIDLGLRNFLSDIMDQRYGRTGGYLLVAPQHRLIVTATDQSRIMEALPAPGINTLRDLFIQGYEGTKILVNPLGVEVLASDKGVPVADWIISAVLPTAEAFAPIRVMQERMLLATLLLSLLIGALTWCMLKRQLAPMLAAAKKLAILADTDQPPQPLPIARQDEVGQLIGGFNRLLEALARQKDALARENYRNEVFLRHSSDGIHVLDADGNVLEVSDAFCRMLGYSRDELIGANLSLWDAQWSPQQLKKRVAEQMAKEGRWVFETMHRRRDGSIFDVEVSDQPVEMDGKLVLFHSARDITERKSAEKALRESERRYHGLFDQANEGLMVMRSDGQLSNVNWAFAEMHGYTVDEIERMDIRKLDVLEQGALEDRADIVGRIQAGEIVRFEVEHYHKDGHIFPLSVTSSKIQLEGETCYLVFYQDISKRKQVEAELERHRHHLEELVLSRTSDLAKAYEAAEVAHRASETRLRMEAEAKMESRKLEAVGTLAAGIAHDFNNILGSVVGFAEMTADDLPDGSDAKHNVAQILSASSRARDLIARMLAFARESPAQPVAVDVVAEVREALVLLRASQPPSVYLSFESGMDEASAAAAVVADPTQIQQIVMNLCINAAHAMDNAGSISICVDPAAKIDGAPLHLVDGICLTVADSGCGMTPAVLERMFDPFFTTKGSSEGSGLGLSVVHGVVVELGGIIEVQSRAGGSHAGTEFRVFLPIEKNTLHTGEMHGAHIVD